MQLRPAWGLVCRQPRVLGAGGLSGEAGVDVPRDLGLLQWFGPSQLHPIPVSPKSLLTFRQEGRIKYRGQLGGGGVGLHCLPGVYF